MRCGFKVAIILGWRHAHDIGCVLMAAGIPMVSHPGLSHGVRHALYWMCSSLRRLCGSALEQNRTLAVIGLRHLAWKRSICQAWARA